LVRITGFWVELVAFLKGCAAVKESQYGGFSTALRFGRNDSFLGEEGEHATAKTTADSYGMTDKKGEG
jgi:hypothetical protein